MKQLQIQWIFNVRKRSAVLYKFNRNFTEILSTSKISVKTAEILIASGVSHGS